MKVTAITPNNFTQVCVDHGILPEAALTEELPEGWFWMRDASGEWVTMNDDGDTSEFLAFESMGQVLSGEFYARDAETGEWEQI
jgi:hypothetical protein